MGFFLWTVDRGLWTIDRGLCCRLAAEEIAEGMLHISLPQV
jgi:hypothetical protein